MTLDAVMEEKETEMPSLDTNLDTQTSPETMEMPSWISGIADYVFNQLKNLTNNLQKRHEHSIANITYSDSWRNPKDFPSDFDNQTYDPNEKSHLDKIFFKSFLAGTVAAIVGSTYITDFSTLGKIAPVGYFITGLFTYLFIRGTTSDFSSDTNLLHYMTGLFMSPKDISKEENTIPYNHRTPSQKEDYLSQFRTLKTIDGKLTDTKTGTLPDKQ